jgi:hypothetical protein
MSLLLMSLASFLDCSIPYMVSYRDSFVQLPSHFTQFELCLPMRPSCFVCHELWHIEHYCRLTIAIPEKQSLHQPFSRIRAMPNCVQLTPRSFKDFPAFEWCAIR